MEYVDVLNHARNTVLILVSLTTCARNYALSGRREWREVLAMTYSFHKAVPEGTAAVTRLLTASQMDDYGDVVDTFQVPD